MKMYLVNLKVGNFRALKAKRYTYKSEIKEEKILEENTTGTFKTIRFHKCVACLIDKQTEAENCSKNYVITIPKHTKKLQEIKERNSCCFEDKI